MKAKTFQTILRFSTYKTSHTFFFVFLNLNDFIKWTIPTIHPSNGRVLKISCTPKVRRRTSRDMKFSKNIISPQPVNVCARCYNNDWCGATTKTNRKNFRMKIKLIVFRRHKCKQNEWIYKDIYKNYTENSQIQECKWPGKNKIKISANI